MIKGSIQKEDITFVNIYAPNIGVKCINQIFTDLKEEIDSNATIVRNCSTPLSRMDSSSRQKNQ